MKLWGVAAGSIALACLVWAGLVLPAHAFQEKKVEEAKFEWKAFDVTKKDGKEESFFQKLETSTTQDMAVVDKGGQPVMKQIQKQTFIIQWTPKEKQDGKYVVEQQIVYVNMSIQIGTTSITYDSDATNQPKNPMTDFFAQLMQVKLTLHIDEKTMKVTKVDNQDKFIEKLGESHPQMKSLLKSILGTDAIKTMSEQTWAAIPVGQTKKVGDKWSSDTIELSMGAIGVYKNKYEYTLKAVKDGKAEIAVEPTMTYKPPTESPSREDALAFKIKGDSELHSNKGDKTGGTVVFDLTKGRIVSSNMKMNVEGTLTIEIGGSDTKVSLKQDQDSKLTTFDTLAEAKKK